jgi:hypothetical protein
MYSSNTYIGRYDVAPTYTSPYTVAQPPYLSAPNYALSYTEKDPWVVSTRRQERVLDYPRELQLKEYYTASDNLHHNPWLAPWSFPDGARCFYCRGQGNRGDIGFPQLPCRGCQTNQWYKPSKNALPHCTECSGEGIWKESFCMKCGGKGVGSFYLPYACPKMTCGVRARTNWEIELHHSMEHLGKPVMPSHSVMVTQPFLLPVGKKWQSNVDIKPYHVAPRVY